MVGITWIGLSSFGRTFGRAWFCVWVVWVVWVWFELEVVGGGGLICGRIEGWDGILENWGGDRGDPEFRGYNIGLWGREVAGPVVVGIEIGIDWEFNEEIWGELEVGFSSSSTLSASLFYYDFF